MRGRKRIRLGIVLGVTLIACLAWISASRNSVLHLAPEEVRLGENGQVAWDKAHQHEPLVLPDQPPPMPEIELELLPESPTQYSGDHYRIHGQFTDEPKWNGMPGEQFTATNNEVLLPGGESLRLEAIGVRRSISSNVEFYDPTSRERLLEFERMHEEGQLFQRYGLIFESPLSFPVPPSVLFVFSGDAGVRMDDVRIFDAETKWLLAEDSFEPSLPEKADEYCYFYCPRILFDSPLAVSVDIPCGEPFSRSVSLEQTSEVVIADQVRVRIEFSTVGEGYGYRLVYAPGQYIRVDPENPFHYVLMAISPESLGEQLRFEFGTAVGVGSQVVEMLYECNFPSLEVSGADSMRVALYPRRARIWFEVAGVPGLPRKHRSDQLETSIEAYNHIFSNQNYSSALEALAMVLQMEVDVRLDQDDHDILRTIDSVALHKLEGLDGLTTAQEILDHFKSLMPGLSVRVDRKNSQLIFYRSRWSKFKERVTDWWN